MNKEKKVLHPDDYDTIYENQLPIHYYTGEELTPKESRVALIIGILIMLGIAASFI